MPPQVITRPGSAAVPLVIGLGALDVLTPQAVFATFNGAGASGSFLPCVTYYTQDGHVFARSFPSESVAAGASADVSWFPGLTAVAASDPNPVVSNELDYVEITVSVAVTAGHTESNQVTLVTSSALVFDGATRVRIEVFSPVFDVEGSNNFIADLWDNTSDLGRIAQLDLDPNPVDLGTPFYAVRYLTPTAGTHTFRLKGWTTGGSGQSSFGAGPGGLGGGGSPNYMPAYMRIST